MKSLFPIKVIHWYLKTGDGSIVNSEQIKGNKRIKPSDLMCVHLINGMFLLDEHVIGSLDEHGIVHYQYDGIQAFI